MLPWVICITGGNFCGKTTQAPLLAEALRAMLPNMQYEFLDTSVYIKKKIHAEDVDEDAVIALANNQETTIALERTKHEGGEANTTEWVADHVVIPEIVPRLHQGTWLFFPGSPRVQYEGRRFAEVLTDLAQNEILSGCLVIHTATPKDVCHDRARRWYEGLTDPVERESAGYKYLDFDKRWAWYEKDTKPTFEILERASGLYVPRITVSDDGTRSIAHIHQEILWKASRAMNLEHV